jgi:hypothetical protein
MSKNNIFTSPLGIGLGVAVGAISIGLIGFGAYKFTGNDTEEISRTSDSEPRSSSMFSLLDERDSSMSEQNEKYEPEKWNVADLNQPNYGHVRVRGGKRSKKRRRNKSKKRNTLKK